jgi:hypothetical protein
MPPKRVAHQRRSELRNRVIRRSVTATASEEAE